MCAMQCGSGPGSDSFFLFFQTFRKFFEHFQSRVSVSVSELKVLVSVLVLRLLRPKVLVLVLRH